MLLINGHYFQNKIENVSFESRQEKKSSIRREYDTRHPVASATLVA